jgi:hypothetical protein
MTALLLTLLALGAGAAPKSAPSLAFSRDVEATVDQHGVSQLAGGAASPDWIYFDGALTWACPGASIRSLELAGPAQAKKVLATSTDAHLQASSVEVQLPLWRVHDAVEACARHRTTLPSVTLTGTLRCEGLAPLTFELSSPLVLTCAPPGDGARPRWDALRVRSAEAILTGSTAPVRITVWWKSLRPTPRAVTVVELDPRGAILERYQTLTPSTSPNAETETLVRIDTASPRLVSFALELTFPDGSSALTTPHSLTVETPAQRAADLERISQNVNRVAEVDAQLHKAFVDPCSQLDAAVTWLNAQPGVSRAQRLTGVSRMTYVVGDRPVLLMCSAR